MLKAFVILDKSLNTSNGSAQDKSFKKGYQVSIHTKSCGVVVRGTYYGYHSAPHKSA